MAVKYFLVQKDNPGDAAAPKKFYATPAPLNKTTVKEISKVKIIFTPGPDLKKSIPTFSLEKTA